jgi:hypothetical protein
MDFYPICNIKNLILPPKKQQELPAFVYMLFGLGSYFSFLLMLYASTGFTYKGLTPHKFMPIPGVHKIEIEFCQIIMVYEKDKKMK